MFLKPIEKSKQLKQLEALDRRMPLGHPRRHDVEKELYKSRAGFYGEKSLDYYFDFLPERDFYILHDIRIPFKSYFFQIDCFLLSSQFFLPIETKHYGGKIIIDPVNHQLIQSQNGVQKIFPDPVLQEEHHIFQFKEWMKKENLPCPQVFPLVVMTNPKSKINILPGDTKYKKIVIRSAYFLNKMQEFTSQLSKGALDQKNVQNIAGQLMAQHKQAEFNIQQKFQIQKSDFLTGVHCPRCFALPMEWRRGCWVCKICLYTSPTAHICTLKDFALLVDKVITNQEFRWFCQIDSESVAQKKLSGMNLPFTGVTRGRKYLLNFDD